MQLYKLKIKLPPKIGLHIIAFITGAIVMSLEMIGSRILSPYFGSSINTWTILIGVVLGSLSIGYWYGDTDVYIVC